MNIHEWMLKNKYAMTGFQASHIYEGLLLWKCGSFDEQVERVKLYRSWRNSKVYGNNRKPCFEKAIKGEPAPAPLIAEAAHCAPLEDSPWQTGMRRGADMKVKAKAKP